MTEANPSLEIDNSLQYWLAVWILPIGALIVTLVIAYLASKSVLASTWASRFGAVCVATGLLAERRLIGPRFRYSRGWWMAEPPAARSAKRFRWEEAVLGPQILFGTLMWAFGDLITKP